MTDPVLMLLPALMRAVGIIFAALLLYVLSGAVSGRFLKYWSLSWVLFGSALLFKSTADEFKDSERLYLPFYFLLSYAHAYYLAAGCRDVANVPPMGKKYVFLWLFGGVIALMGTVLLPSPASLRAMHTLLISAYLCLTLRWASLWKSRELGRTVFTGTLVGLTLVYLHFFAVFSYVAITSQEHPELVKYSPFLLMVFNASLVFGMVLAATDRIRGELELKNEQLEKIAEQLALSARTDSLTGLLNRRAFDELGQHDDGEMKGSIAVIDLKSLKRLNDEHGHATGDVAIKIVARALRTHFRVTDPIFRIGGDEFVVIMVDCRESDLKTRLTKLEAMLHSQRLPRVAGVVDLSIAWGVSTFEEVGKLHEAFRAADMQMYRCKREKKSALFGF